MRNIRNTITPALVLDKHMIPCRDENEKRLLYAYLSKKRELAEHLSQIIYVLDDVLEWGDVVVLPYRVNAVMDCDVPYALAWEIKLRVLPCEDVVPAKP